MTNREVLTSLLKTYIKDVEVIGQAASVDEAFNLIGKLKPDLVFLDIQMPNENGFSLLKRFENEVPFEVVFVTSFNQFAINAIKFSALDYLLKPVEIVDLIEAIEKAKQVIESKKQNNLRVINLIKNLENTEDKKIVVHAGEKVKFLDVRMVEYIEADGRYSHIYMMNSDNYITARNLKDFEEYLGEKSDFVRINKSYLLNVKAIESYSKGDPCIIETLNGKVFEASRRKKQEVLDVIKRK